MNIQNKNFNSEEKEYTISDIYYIIRKHYKIIASSFILIVLSAIYYNLISKPIYNSKAVIMVSEDKNTMSLLEMSISNNMNFIENEIEIIKSRTISEKVINRLLVSNYKDDLFILNTKQYTPSFFRKILTFGYDSFDELNVSSNINDSLKNIFINRLQKNIVVENNRKTDLINISLSSLSAQEAALLVNTLVDVYRESDLEWVTGEMSHLKDFLYDQIEQKEIVLDEAEEKLKNFQKEEKIFTIDDNSKLLLSNLTEFETKYNTTLAAISILEERDKYINSKLTSEEKILASKVASTINERLFALKNEVAKLEAELISTINQSGKNHSAVGVLTNKINKLKKNIESETRELISQGISAADPIQFRQVLMDSSISIQAGKSNLASKLSAYKDLVDMYESKLRLLPEKLIEFTRLERQRLIQAETYAFMLQKLEEARIGEASKLGKIRIIDKAIPNNNPISPKKIINLFFSIFLSLSLGILLSILIEYFDNTLRSIEQIERLGIPILALIPAIDSKSKNKKAYSKPEKLKRRLITTEDPKSPISESYRSLRTSLMYSRLNEKCIKILISSPGPGEGKSTTISNLAITYANLGKKTLLIDSDLRKPVLHKVFNVDNTNGLTSFLSNNTTYDKIIKKTSVDNLFLVNAGIVPPNPSELLHSFKMEEFMKNIVGEYDVVLFDSPPLVAVTDSYVLMKYISQFVLVIRVGVCEKGGMKRVMSDFENAKFNISGIVVNAITEEHSYGSGYYYNYYQYYYGTKG